MINSEKLLALLLYAWVEVKVNLFPNYFMQSRTHATANYEKN